MRSLSEKNKPTEVFSQEEKEINLRKIFVEKVIPDPSGFYQGKGRDLYEKIGQSKEYRANKVELALIQKYAPLIVSYIEKYITDIGCGDGYKAIQILKNLDKDQLEVTYIASDASATMIELTEENFKKELPNIKLGNHQIMRPGNDLFTNNLEGNLYLCLGFLLGDFDRPGMIEELKKMNNKGVLKGNKIVFSYFEHPKTPQEVAKTKSLYENEVGKDFIFNYIKNLGLDTNMFDHVVNYDEQKHCVYLGIRTKADYPIQMGSQKQILPANTVYNVYQSERFSDDEISHVLKEIGSKKLEHFSQDGVSIIVAKKDPKYFKRALKIAGVTAMLSLATLGGQQVIQHHQEKIQDENIEKAINAKANSMRVFSVFEGKGSTLDSSNMREYLKERSFALSNVFVKAYGKGSLTRRKIQYLMLQCMDEKVIEGMINNDDVWSTQKFIEEVFIPQNPLVLAESGINTEIQPYEQFTKYRQEFINSLNCSLEDRKFSDWDVRLEMMGLGGYPKEVQTYATGYQTYEVGYVQIDGKKCMVAKSIEYETEFSLGSGRYVAEDFLLRKNKTIKDAIMLFFEACPPVEWQYTYDQKSAVQTMMLKLMINENVGLQSPTALVQACVDQNKEVLAKLGIVTTPYPNIIQHREAFQNSVKYFDAQRGGKGDDFLLPTYKQLAKYDFKFLGMYTTKEGIKYDIAYMTVDGVEYALAFEINPKYGDDDLSIYDATEVAKDFTLQRLNKKSEKKDVNSSHVEVYRSPEKPKNDTINKLDKYKPGAKYGYSGLRKK